MGDDGKEGSLERKIREYTSDEILKGIRTTPPKDFDSLSSLKLTSMLFYDARIGKFNLGTMDYPQRRRKLAELLLARLEATETIDDNKVSHQPIEIAKLESGVWALFSSDKSMFEGPKLIFDTTIQDIDIENDEALCGWLEFVMDAHLCLLKEEYPTMNRLNPAVVEVRIDTINQRVRDFLFGDTSP